jgi:hypothetical protein
MSPLIKRVIAHFKPRFKIRVDHVERTVFVPDGYAAASESSFETLRTIRAATHPGQKYGDTWLS